MSSRMAPHHCPYCGEQDLRPAETGEGWECRDCARFFAVKFLGLAAASLADVHQGQQR